jgi:hypothetical protein
VTRTTCLEFMIYASLWRYSENPFDVESNYLGTRIASIAKFVTI